MAAKTTPDTVSSDHEAMSPYWAKVDTILGGAETMRAAGETYLPQFPNETDADYDYRRENAKFTNIFADIVGTLASKPFGEEVAVANDGASDAIKMLAEDIDGRGNHLHVFAANTFYAGINDAVSWILVDYTKARTRADGRPLSLDEEKRQGLRPYWVHIPARRMLAVYSDVIQGKETFIHARISETVLRREGFGEVSIERVRVFNRDPIFEVLADGKATDQIVDYAPATFAVYEKKAKTGNRGGHGWDVAESGDVTLGVIPLVPFVTGRRLEGAWRFAPPMLDAADLQIEHYQEETRLKMSKELVGSPMLAGNGVQPSLVDGQPAPVPVGPKAVLYAPPYGDSGSHGEWKYIVIDAAGLTFLASQVDATEKQLRELGRQPLMTTSGITVVAASFATQKAGSVLKAWALGLKDALEQALMLTAKWLGDGSEPTIVWNLDDLDLDLDGQDGPTTLLDARKNGDLSQETLWSEFKRRSILSADFDADEERQRIEDEMSDPDTGADMLGALPPPVDPSLDPANDPNLDPALAA